MTELSDPVTEAVAPVPAPLPDAAPAAVPTEPVQAPDAPPVRRPGRRRAALVMVLVLLPVLVAAGVSGALVLWDAGYEGRVLPGVHVGDVDLSGLDRDQALVALTAAYPLDQGSLVLHTPDGDLSVPYAEVGRRLDVDALVDEAMAAGRAGELLDRTAAEIRQALDGSVIQPRVVLDATAVAAAVTARLTALDRPPVDATVTMGPNGIVTTPARAGRSVDTQPLADAAVASLRPLDAPARVVLQVVPVSVAPMVDNTDVADAIARADRMVANVVLTHKDRKWTIKAARVRRWLRFEPRPAGSVAVVVDPSTIPASLRKPTKAALRKPLNAQFLKTRGGKVVGVIASKDGRRLDIDATVARITALLDARAQGTPGARVAVATFRTYPRITTEEARKTAPVMSLLGKWTTYFPISDRNFYGANIWRPAEIINGTVLRPGQSFDWWDAIWPVTPARGFGPGGIIRSNHTDPTGALGGGMCSSSTTLFNAAMRAGLAMLARSNHKYYISRYPLGLDATVSVIGTSRQTMSFTNDTGHPIVIRGIRTRNGSAGYVRYEIWGIPDGRTVSVGRPVLGNVRKATTRTVLVDTLPHGVRDQVEYPSDGMDVSVTRVVRNARGRILHHDTWISRYVLWNGLIQVGR